MTLETNKLVAVNTNRSKTIKAPVNEMKHGCLINPPESAPPASSIPLQVVEINVTPVRHASAFPQEAVITKR